MRPDASIRRERLLFAAALAVYAAAHLWGLERFPIYFHGDEAFGPLTALDLAENGLRDPQGHLLPVYFQPAPSRWMPIGTVYVHLLTTSVFGVSIWVTRATTAVVCTMGAAALALALRDGFGVKRWWSGILLLGAMPGWFIHSRSGFEAAMMAAAFAVVLWCYLRYRKSGSGRWAFATVLAAAATFYAYSNGQAVIAAFGLAVAIVDLRFHWRYRRQLVPALLTACIVAWPLVAHRRLHPDAELEHLRAIDSYLVDPRYDTIEKTGEFLRRYASGFHPRYWFVSHDPDDELRGIRERWPALAHALYLDGNLDITRHRYRGRGPLALWMLPLFALGLAITLRCWRSPSHRILILALLATPVGAATAEIGITRVLAFVVPAAMLCTLGLETILDTIGGRIARVRGRPGRATAITWATFVALAAADFELLATALRRADRWYGEYGLYGMQWGARQLFTDAVPKVLESDPRLRLMLTSDWANAADRFPRFFLKPEQLARVRMRSVGEALLDPIRLDPSEVWVVTDHELGRVVASRKFVPPDEILSVAWPDGRPGFHFVRLSYTPDAGSVFAAEREERRRPVDATVVLDGEKVAVRHSRADRGRAVDLFDARPQTLLRGLEANPFVIEVRFPTPRTLSAISALFAGMRVTWEIMLYPPEAGEPVSYRQTLKSTDSPAMIPFERGPHRVDRVVLSIHQEDQGDSAHVHVRELGFSRADVPPAP